jgi:hypothetical protein
MHLSKIAFLVAFMASLAVPAARAQDYDMGAAVDMNGMYILGMEDAVMDAAREGTKTKSRVTKHVTVPLTFTPSAQRRRKFLDAYIAKMRTKDPQGAENMKRLIASRDLFAEAGKIMAGYGLRANNVADAYAVWWVSSWHGSRGRQNNPTRAQLQAVKAQASRALSQVAKSGRLNEAARQQIAEACLLQAMMIDGALENAKGNPAQLQQIARAVSQGARTAGLNLAAMELTPKGFVVKA